MRRILRNVLITALAAALLYGFDWVVDASFRDARYFSGWVLLSAMVFLVLYNVRKKLPMLRLGRAARWMQAHLYVGYFVVAAFALHTEFSMPDTAFEWGLWLAFVLVAISGIIGIYLVKTVPPTLEQHAERILFQRIPGFRSQLADEAENLAIHSIDTSGSLTISNLYVDMLHDFFRQPRNLVSHLRNSRRPLNRILDEIRKLERYLDDKGKATLGQIRDLVIAKDNLDYHYANQGVLRLWLFVHVPMTYGLVILTAAHVAVMYAYSTGVP